MIVGLGLTLAGTVCLAPNAFPYGWITRRDRQRMGIEAKDLEDVAARFGQRAYEQGYPGPWHVLDRGRRQLMSRIGLALIALGLALQAAAVFT